MIRRALLGGKDEFPREQTPAFDSMRMNADFGGWNLRKVGRQGQTLNWFVMNEFEADTVEEGENPSAGVRTTVGEADRIG